MAETIQFELVSPDKLLVSEPVEMVVIPGAEGDFGVLAQHAPFISAVRRGAIVVHEGGKPKDSYFVRSGFAEVTGDLVTVLAESAVNLGEVKRAEQEQKIKDLQDDIADAKSDDERAKLEAELQVQKDILALVN